jgi:hypothetical protein
MRDRFKVVGKVYKKRHHKIVVASSSPCFFPSRIKKVFIALFFVLIVLFINEVLCFD